MSILNEQIQHPNVGNVVELFKVDATNIGGTVLYLTPSGLNISFGGIDYIPAPIQINNRSFDLESAPTRPTLTVSGSRDSAIFQMVLAYGDLVGATVEYTKTFSNFLDGGVDANPLEHFPVERFNVIQRTSLSAMGISFLLSTPLDQPTLQLPRRQILKDNTGSPYTLWAPAVGRVRAQ